MHQTKKPQAGENQQASPKVSGMRAYQFDYQVDESHRISFELPAHAPVGLTQIIAVFQDAPEHLTYRATQQVAAD
ncbi:MAG: hypothetical protein GW848_03520 [Rhodoferax sp.]|nr:hypothetical protein [Rhodoferax sp.]OIP17364.1 MAG: hypothetical protein AUK51_07985 [Comamonadaceae bacterium CG2_30_59_20]PIW07282.1 MAG: hypothetical protein COW39_14040 [Comamonadaceae bacterium CG17_big_fil_post_rev_8_21_14_2_50_60_13]PIY25640.1 MAG: hypothetical protein COZ10_04605 [Comamonadaceae bacterium CG_4_10_14_3_um_filter_60_75]PJC13774.1 MAG: hypothetical protein CO066_07355 [Comamonadaceae bacterium CG_4_9_14_0_8_um_filter_60_18]